jgi:hypothetical protein
MNRIQSVDKTQPSSGISMRDARGIIFIDYLEKGQTINSEYYMALLERLNDEINKKTAPFEEKKVLFHQDTVCTVSLCALCHKSIKTT